MNFNFQSYDPMRMESELQEAKLQQKDPQWGRRDLGKRMASRIVTVIVCLVLLYFLVR